MPKIVIIGAGPTGIGAAMRLAERGETDFLVLDALSWPGGLSASHVDQNGFTWDLGGHVQFSHYQVFDEYMTLALGEEGWLHHQRESWVWMRNRFIPYPFQYNLHRLPPEEKWECVRGLLAVAANAPKPQNFGEWILTTFGQGLADVFMRPYNSKVWAFPPERMSAAWVGERVAIPDITKVLEGICLNKDQVSWGPNATFRFPRQGGTGAIWRSLCNRIPQDLVKLRSTAVRINSDTQQIELADGQTIHYQFLISCMPLDRLTQLLQLPELSRVSSRLLHSGTHVIGIGLRGNPPKDLSTKCWMYFPENNCPFYRVTVFSNYSPYNTPHPGSTWSLMAEVSTSPEKAIQESTIIHDTVEGMLNTHLINSADQVISRWHHFLPYGYPTPSVDRDAILASVLPELERSGIYSRGRFGAWKYEVSNQDHSFMQGWECVDRILDRRGADAEPTLHTPNVVNGTYQKRQTR